LARLVSEALAEHETTRPAQRSERPKVKEVMVRVERTLASIRAPQTGRMDRDDLELESDLAEMLAMLRMMPPNLAVPAEIADMEFMYDDSEPLGPTQLAFIERNAARLLPHDIDLLAELMCHENASGRGLEFMNLHLGPEPSVEQLARAVVVSSLHLWEQLETHAFELLLRRCTGDAVALARALVLLADAGMGRHLTKPVALALLAAFDELGSTDGFDPAFVRRAEGLAGKRRRKPKKTPDKSKKKPAKKKPAKKKVAKKTAPKKTAPKKQAASAPRQRELFESEDD
jgi:hypothetical protein